MKNDLVEYLKQENEKSQSESDRLTKEIFKKSRDYKNKEDFKQSLEEIISQIK
ncbi:hypothetical protein [Autumnicola psychrophila]|uniref:Uncharacterized protein n=1 Tax=Autumnicola psychrophila TaxID=3075592 RepID=A0ABU3DVU6_9FLAO|nr:hypothetical protein [Zunongwangia sp. F225]MDT0687836.1 hypothetical protein [Zunongwangia sp. F225]